MKKAIFIIVSAIVISCAEDQIGPGPHTQNIKNQFNGKYEVISSFPQDEVDLNRDGISSTNLLEENPEISRSQVELKILINSDQHSIMESWPVEYISVPLGEVLDSTGFHANYSVQYALHAKATLFKFQNQYSAIQLLQDFAQYKRNTLVRIDSITVLEDGVIQVIAVRKLYTRNGWITTKTESRYRRYTIVT